MYLQCTISISILVYSTQTSQTGQTSLLSEQACTTLSSNQFCHPLYAHLSWQNEAETHDALNLICSLCVCILPASVFGVLWPEEQISSSSSLFSSPWLYQLRTGVTAIYFYSCVLLCLARTLGTAVHCVHSHTVHAVHATALCVHNSITLTRTEGGTKLSMICI